MSAGKSTFLALAPCEGFGFQRYGGTMDLFEATRGISTIKGNFDNKY